MKTKKGRRVLRRLKIKGHLFDKLIDTDMPKPVLNVIDRVLKENQLPPKPIITMNKDNVLEALVMVNKMITSNLPFELVIE